MKVETLEWSPFLESMMAVGTDRRIREPMKVPEPAKTDASAETTAKTRGIEEALRQTEAVKGVEQARLEAAKRALPDMIEAFKRASAKALHGLHFDLDKSDITDQAKPTLDEITEFMNDFPAVKIQIEGHCDERETLDYLNLGERRAEAVKRYLVGMGIEEGRLDITNFGHEKPLCTKIESCCQQNRQVHFLLR